MPLTKAETSRLRGLRLKKNREAAAQFIVENPKVIAELLAVGHPFEAIYATMDWTPPPGVSPVIITAIEMSRMSHYPSPGPVLAVGKIQRHALEPDEINQGLTLALDGIQDPGNVGTLLRIADWFGLDRVLLSPDCADLFSQKVINASMGSFVRIRSITTELTSALADCTRPIIGCDLAGEDLGDFTPPSHAVIVIGSEGQGISPDVSTMLTQRVTIPRMGHAESLNAAVAAGIVCHHFRSPV